MTTSPDSSIPEILKLYDMADVTLTSDLHLQMNGLVPDNDSMVQSCSDSQENVIHQSSKLLEYARECYIECFQMLQSHLSVLLECDGFKMGFERAFTTLFGQDVQTFTDIMILNLDQLRQQLDREETTNAGSLTALCVLSKQLQSFINSKSAMIYDSRVR